MTLKLQTYGPILGNVLVSDSTLKHFEVLKQYGDDSVKVNLEVRDGRVEAENVVRTDGADSTALVGPFWTSSARLINPNVIE